MQGNNPKWLDMLADEDLAFIKRFILASGSLKQVAGEYGISYPTVRLRLDRLIQKIQILDDQAISSEFERLARSLSAEGGMDMNTLKALLAAHNREMEARNETK